MCVFKASAVINTDKNSTDELCLPPSCLSFFVEMFTLCLTVVLPLPPSLVSKHLAPLRFSTVQPWFIGLNVRRTWSFSLSSIGRNQVTDLMIVAHKKRSEFKHELLRSFQVHLFLCDLIQICASYWLWSLNSFLLFESKKPVKYKISQLKPHQASFLSLLKET